MDQPMESDETDKMSASDDEQENRAFGNVCADPTIASKAFNSTASDLTGGKQNWPFGKLAFKQQSTHAFNPANASKANDKIEQLDRVINQKQQLGVNCDKNQAMMVNRPISIGKSDALFARLEASDGNQNSAVKSIGKSEFNFSGKHFEHPGQYYPQPIVGGGKQQPMEIYESVSGKGKLPPSQYPGKCSLFYSNCKCAPTKKYMVFNFKLLKANLNSSHSLSRRQTATALWKTATVDWQVDLSPRFEGHGELRNSIK